jgi:uncharacterized protein (DUF433 family)
LESIALYPDRDELKRQYPELDDEDIQQALAFAAGDPGRAAVSYFGGEVDHLII